jgi:AcrR family transcriptional regulator
MRRHGWRGHPPADHDQAIRRILDAAHQCIERDGDVGIAEVAREVGVTRQTVYRYFRTTNDLLVATATEDAAAFLGHLETHLAGHDWTASAAVVEGVAYTLEQLPHEPSLGLLLSPRRIGVLSRDFTSPIAIALGRSVVDRFDIGWERLGLSETDLDELVEHVLRTVQSFAMDPGTPPRTGNVLRAYLTRWLRPGIDLLLGNPIGTMSTSDRPMFRIESEPGPSRGQHRETSTGGERLKRGNR